MLDDAEQEFSIVGSTEADPFANKISDDSPLGKALIGSREGDTITAVSYTHLLPRSGARVFGAAVCAALRFLFLQLASRRAAALTIRGLFFDKKRKTFMNFTAIHLKLGIFYCKIRGNRIRPRMRPQRSAAGAPHHFGKD